MAYRIHRSMNGENVVFSLSGTMDEEQVTDLRGLLADEGNRRVHLDLEDVTLVNHDGVVFLARAEAEGVVLVNCPDYVRSWIAAEHPAALEGGMMPTIATRDGTQLYYKDWGSGPPVVFSHGWPLSADSWEAQMLFLATHGFRCIAHDRRGHGRSSQPWTGNEMDTYADDLAALLDTLDVRKATLVGFSTGGGEVARYIGRHGTTRVAKAVLVSAVPPLMVRTAANPGGLPIDVFDGLRAASIVDRSKLYKDLASGPFFGFNRPGAVASQGMIDSFWLQGMLGGHKNTLDCIKAFSETDFTDDLKKFDRPTLVIHGDDDQIVPIDAAGRASARLIRNATLKVYPGAPHGVTDTHKEQLNADLLAFVKT